MTRLRPAAPTPDEARISRSRSSSLQDKELRSSPVMPMEKSFGVRGRRTPVKMNENFMGSFPMRPARASPFAEDGLYDYSDQYGMTTPTYFGSPNASTSRISPPVAAINSYLDRPHVPPNVPQPSATRVLHTSTLPPGQPMKASHSVFNLTSTPFAWLATSWSHNYDAHHHYAPSSPSRGTSPVACDMATQTMLDAVTQTESGHSPLSISTAAQAVLASTIATQTERQSVIAPHPMSPRHHRRSSSGEIRLQEFLSPRFESMRVSSDQASSSSHPARNLFDAKTESVGTMSPRQRDVVRRISNDDSALVELEKTIDRQYMLVTNSYASQWTRKNKQRKEDVELASAHVLQRPVSGISLLYQSNGTRPTAPDPERQRRGSNPAQPPQELLDKYPEMEPALSQPGGCAEEDELELARSPSKGGNFTDALHALEAVDSKPRGIRIDLSRVHLDRNSPPAHSPASSARLSILSSPHSAFSAVSLTPRGTHSTIQIGSVVFRSPATVLSAPQ